MRYLLMSFLVLFITQSAHAAVNLSVLETEKWNVSFELENSGRIIVEDDVKGKFAAKVQIKKGLLAVSYSTSIRNIPVAVHAKAGAGKLEAFELNKFSSDVEPVFEAGFTANVLKWGHMLIFLSGNSTYLNVDDMVETGKGVGGLENETIRWLEYELDLGAEFMLPGFRPFGGIRFSRLQASDVLSVSGNIDISTQERTGLFLGLRHIMKHSLMISFGYSVFDKRELTLKVGIGF